MSRRDHLPRCEAVLDDLEDERNRLVLLLVQRAHPSPEPVRPTPRVI